jgi:hypothetical protein
VSADRIWIRPRPGEVPAPGSPWRGIAIGTLANRILQVSALTDEVIVAAPADVVRDALAELERRGGCGLAVDLLAQPAYDVLRAHLVRVPATAAEGRRS